MDVELTGHGVEQFATPRIVGRRLNPADSDFLTDLHADEDVMADHGGTRSRATTERFLRSNSAHWRRYQVGLYAVSLSVEPDTPIGRAGMRWDRMEDETWALDVSLLLEKRHWGQGIGTEAFRALATIGLDLNFPLVSGCHSNNAPARRVMEKAGFIYWDDYDRHDQVWVRYHWPAHKAPPANIRRPGR